jgi:hypothetical protein
MGQTIYKYELEIKDIQEIEMPEDSSIVSIAVQHGVPCIWALADPSARMIKRTFELYGTGHPIRGTVDGKFRFYLETFLMLNGNIVYHLFETKI